LIVVGIVLFVSGGQAHTVSGAVEHRGRLLLYLVTIFFEWVMVGLIWLGIHRRGIRLRDLVGGRWKSPEAVFIDVGIAAAFWVVSVGVLFGMQYALGLAKLHEAEGEMKARLAKIGFLFPQSKYEIAVYVALVLTAGFCEELIFRGYLQKQFHAMTGNAYLAVILQALTFGAAHGYQGVKLMIVIAVYGLLFGLLALWIRNLRPGMIAHAWQDLLAGLVGRWFVQHMH
jgi:membrane protease YdiL (CAAX protease family)